MIECDEGEDKKPRPIQQTQQPQPVEGTQDESWAARAGSLSHGILSGAEKGARDTARDEAVPALDRARFTAGVVRFYEAILKEPIPEKMLRLIDELEKRERKS
ncbi:MAG: hypothetical protein ACLPPF_04440 [Rhodomicrobium sp.]